MDLRLGELKKNLHDEGEEDGRTSSNNHQKMFKNVRKENCAEARAVYASIPSHLACSGPSFIREQTRRSNKMRLLSVI